MYPASSPTGRLRIVRIPRTTGIAPVIALPSVHRDGAVDPLGGSMRGPSISTAAEEYLHGRLDRGELEVASAAKIATALRELERATGDGPVRRLDRRSAEAWMAETAHLKASTRRLRWGFVSQFCEWAVDEALLERNPFRTVKPPKPARRPPRALPHDAVARLLAVVPDLRGRLIVLLMVQLGLRCVEVARLEVTDVDFGARSLRVRGKGSHERVLPITEECWDALGEYLGRHPASVGPLVRAWSPNGGSLACSAPRASSRPVSEGSISKLMSGWMYAAGVKSSPRDGRSAHALRHTCATDMLNNGADLLEVRDTLGHTSVATTQVYLGSATGRLRSSMEGRRYGGPVAVEEVVA